MNKLTILCALVFLALSADHATADVVYGNDTSQNSSSYSNEPVVYVRSGERITDVDIISNELALANEENARLRKQLAAQRNQQAGQLSVWQRLKNFLTSRSLQ